ncbi:MFS transporter [uncultured Maricaulis sp.]|uniref:MFS transporter n=1 Tax=uncultured Maricaulis sp. TaxID=174710 RepID=UPI002639FE7E|nr:MFS transporter [uncultured Maricaulis sp.]
MSTQMPTPSGTDSYRNVAAIVIALAILQTATGALSVVGPLTLVSQGAGPLKIGAIVSSYALGFLLGARLAPREIMQIGHIRAIAGFAAAASLGAAALYVSGAMAWWMLIQFIIGVSVAGFLASGESWIADAAPSQSRGAILGFYLVTSKLGFMAGPFLVAGAPAGTATGFLIVAALLTASLIPVCATRRAEPAAPTTQPFSPVKIWNFAPSAIIAATISGMVSGAVLQLYAVYIQDFAADSVTQTAALFNAAMIGGSVIATWPAGILSDRIDRRMVIAGLALTAGAAALVLALFTGLLPRIGIFAVAALWGAGALSYYGVAVAHAADRAPDGQATSTMSGILMVWALGSMAGPLVASAVMSLTGPSGLFFFAAVALFSLTGLMLIRRSGTAPVREEDKSDFEPTATTSVSVVELTDHAEEDADWSESQEAEFEDASWRD